MRNIAYVGITILIVGIILFLFAPSTFPVFGNVLNLKNAGVLLVFLGGFFVFIGR